INIDYRAPYLRTWDISTVPYGNTIEVRAYANDTLGNIGTNYTVYNITKDKTGPTIVLVSPLNNSGDNDGDITIEFNVTDIYSEINNCSLYVDNVLNKTNSTIFKQENSFSLTGIDIRKYNWSIKCFDSLGNSESSGYRYFTKIKTTEFQGRTTDLSTVDVSNIENLVIEYPVYGMINYSEIIDLSSGVDIDLNLNMSHNYINLDSLEIPELNKSAVVSLYNLSFIEKPVILRNNNFCSDIICMDIGYNNNNLTFSVTEFSSYSSTENSNLIIYDETDLGNIRYKNQQVRFYANFTNKTSGEVINGTGIYCEIDFLDTSEELMTFANTVYWYERDFVDYGIYSYSVFCNGSASGFEPVYLTDNVTITLNREGTFIINFSSVSQFSFLNGEFSDTYLNISEQAIELNNSNTGFFFSQVFNAGKNVSWLNISWSRSALGNLPSDGQIEKNGANMTGNVLLMHLDETSGDIVDHSGNNNDATNIGVDYSQSGKIGYSMYFNGTGAVLESSSYTYNFQEELTLAAWFKYVGSGSGSPRLIEISSSGDYDSHCLAVDLDASVRAWVECDDDVRKAQADDSTTYNDGKWHYLVYTYDNPDGTIYVDGNEKATASGDCNNLDDGVYLAIGSVSEGSGVYDYDDHSFDGYIDEVAVWNRSLSQEEILYNYMRGMQRLNITVRSCNNSQCSNTDWNETFDDSPVELNVVQNQYFQYKINFETKNISYSPKMYNVTIQYVGHPIVIINSPQNMAYSTTQNKLNTTITDADNCWYSLNDWQTNISYDCENTTIIGTEGENTLRIKTSNNGGLENTDEYVDFI
ncbi:MAG: LamG domain-containing protein, partial [Nanoarchaeota archaeon]|nr:LamG domain-containing protein [Nanoarchaeota archaeon]